MPLHSTMHSRCILILSIFIIGWICFLTFIPSYPGSIDIFHFKDPACNYSLGKGLISASYVGSSTSSPVFFFSNPPLYTWLFAGVFSLLGCRPSVSVALDIIISCLCTIALIWILWTRLQDQKILRSISVIIFVVVAPTGTLTLPSDRPDHFALLFALIAIAMPVSSNKCFTTYMTRGFLVGLIASTQPFVAVAAVVCIVTNDLAKSKVLYVWKVSPIVLQWIWWHSVGGIIMPITIFLISYVSDPSSIERLLTHMSILGRQRENYLGAVTHAIFSSGVHSGSLMLNWLISFLTLSGILCVTLHNRLISLAFRACGAILVVAMPLIMFPRQNNYYGISAILGLVLIVLQNEKGKACVNMRNVAACSLILCSIVTSITLFAGVMIRISTIQSWKLERKNAEMVASEFFAGRRFSNKDVFLTTSYHFWVHRALPNIGDIQYIEILHQDNILGVADCVRQDHRLSGLRNYMGALLLGTRPSDIESDPRDGIVEFMGRRIMRSNWSFSCDLAVRVKNQ